MKKKLLFLPFVAALALTACSDDEPAVNGGNDVEGTQFLAINIATTPEGGSRADETVGPEGTPQYGDLYEDGTAEENKIEMVRFYFFNKLGQPVSINNTTNQSYFDWTLDKNEDYGSGTDHTGNAANGESGTVERKLKAIVVVETSNTGELPSEVVAVINPTRKTLENTQPSLLTIRDFSNNYTILANNDKKFVMSNSVYANSEPREVTTTAITANNYQKEKKLAEENPVIIHVERTVAKVRVKSSLTTQEVTTADGKTVQLVALKKKVSETKDGVTTTTDEPLTINVAANPETKAETKEQQQVYLKIEGWNVTRTLENSYLLKHIDPTWNPTSVFPGTTNTPWNDPNNFRSYWAEICTNQPYGEIYGDFEHSKAIQLGGKVYATENAEHTSTEEGSKFNFRSSEVIISGTLCDETGAPLTLCEYAGSRMIGEEALIDTYLNMLRSSDHSHYYKDGDTYKEIGRDHITFLTATEARKQNLISDDEFKLYGQTPGAYYVYATLSDDAKNMTWYKDSKGKTAEDASLIIAHLKGQGRAKIWKEGRTYYYTEIQHLGTSAGVVRNHIYDINLTGLYGLGTPVYKPEETIYPEKPSPDDSYLACQVRILSWRVVKQDVTLDWGD